MFCSFVCILYYINLFSSGANVRSIAFLNAETALHDYWGGQEYWMARRSMRFNSILMEAAKKFRREVLNSTDAFDETERPNDWRHETVHICSFKFYISKTNGNLSNILIYVNNCLGASYGSRWKLLVCPFETS